MAEDLHIDMEELAREIRLVDKKFASAVKRNLRKAVTEAGAEVTAAVKARASWSKGTVRPDDKEGKSSGRTSIPAATSLAMSFGAEKVSVRVKVNAKKAPHARPLEFGTKGNPGMNRHPVFVKKGQKVAKGRWVNQPTREFFFSAAEALTPTIERKIQTAIDTIAIDAGFKGR